MNALAHVEETTWPSIRSKVELANADLASNVELVAQGGLTEHLFIARYRYGQVIVRDGNFLSPCAAQGSGPCGACKTLSRAVAYSHIPLAMVLENSAEVYLEYKDKGPLRTAPLRILRPGGLFGVFETLDALTDGKKRRPAPWNVSAGARSVVLLGPVSNDELQKPLARALDVTPSDLRWGEMKHDNWALVREIANLSHADWYARLLLFPRNWLMSEGVGSRDLTNYVFKVGWQQSRYLRESAAEEALFAASRKTRLHHYRTVLHLLSIARGDVPAFEPVVSDCGEAGPFYDTLGILRGVISDYTPIILQPCHLSKPGSAGYYSVSRPSIPGPISDGHAHIDDLIQIWNEIQQLQDTGFLDKSATKQFVLGSARHGSSNLHQLPVSDLFRKDFQAEGTAKLFPRSTSGNYFFSACLRIVRK